MLKEISDYTSSDMDLTFSSSSCVITQPIFKLVHSQVQFLKPSTVIRVEFHFSLFTINAISTTAHQEYFFNVYMEFPVFQFVSNLPLVLSLRNACLFFTPWYLHIDKTSPCLCSSKLCSPSLLMSDSPIL